MARHKCPVCGLYIGRTAHSGPLHRRIMANRARLRRGLSLRGGLRRRLRR
jgi:hypothetical protein